ncbi:MAG: hypothetical protein IJ960_09705 [Oscillospiraceae bacterium]|nr:hypothetical protein [Oscillospiraceae bacterium]
MRFHRNISAELRNILSAQLQDYEKATDMCIEERRELRQWVLAGHSPYDNGWYLCNEDGCPLDFIHALRIVEDEAAMKECTYAYDTAPSEPMILVRLSGHTDPAEELPF